MKSKSEVDPNFARGSLIQRGTTLSQFARLHGYSPELAHYAVYGKRHGPKTQRFLEILKEELAS